MDISLFLAKCMGIYLLLASALIAYRRQDLPNIIKEYFKNPALAMVGGALSLMIGILIVVSHNVWRMDWRVVITLLGYMALVKGIVHWFFNDFATSFYSKLAKSQFFLIASIVWLLLGLFLIYTGYKSLIL